MARKCFSLYFSLWPSLISSSRYGLNNFYNRMWPVRKVSHEQWTVLLAGKELVKLGWKVHILKYNLGKSLSKEMWCKMADTNNNFYHILKTIKIACNKRKILFASVDTKMISPYNELYIGNVLVCAHFSSKLACVTYCLCYMYITQLFRF